MTELIRGFFGQLFEKELISEIEQVAEIRVFEEGEILIDIGQYIRSMPLLLDGAVKIMREDPDEGELLLYFLEKGDTCAMTLACCMGDKQSEIRAIAENPSTVAMIPVEKMEAWLGKFKSWRSFVFNSYNNRLAEMLRAIDNLAFLKMDERLLKYLQENAKINQSKTIYKTHQEIAYELNTSRVVVSRLLKAFENEGKIKLNRNNIDLLKT